MNESQNTSAGKYVGDLRRALATGEGGIEYAAAVGLITAIARRRRYGTYGTKTSGMTDADRLDEICLVLDALDAVTGVES